jgi:hypothetical protein
MAAAIIIERVLLLANGTLSTARVAGEEMDAHKYNVPLWTLELAAQFIYTNKDKRSRSPCDTSFRCLDRRMF